MKKLFQARGKRFSTIELLLFAGLILLNYVGIRNHIFFHFSAELFTVIVSTCLFAIVWVIREKIDEGYFTILAIGLAFAAVFDLLHNLTFGEVRILSGFSLDHSYHFWIAGRFLQGVTLLLAPICVGRQTNNRLAGSAYLLVSLIIAFLITFNWLPPVIDPAGSFSNYKVAMEILLIVLFMLAILHTNHKKVKFDLKVYRFILASLLSALASEVFISLSGQAHVVSMLGLNLKMLSYALIFQTVLVEGIAQPQELFYRGLKNSWEQLQDLINNLSEGIAILDQQDRFIFNNPIVCQILGAAPKKITGSCLTDYLSQDQAQKYYAYKQKHTQQKTSSIELEINSPGKIHRTIILTSSPRVVDGKFSGLFIVLGDISEKKKMEQEQQSLARFPEENPNPVLRLHQDGRLLFANQSGRKILKSWKYQEKKRLPAEIINKIEACIKSNKTVEFDFSVDKLTFSFSLTPIAGMGYVNMYGKDVTMWRKAEVDLMKYSQGLEKLAAEKTAQLVQAQEKLIRQEKLALMGQLASGVGHELRNPLAVINNALYMLRLQKNSKDKVTREYLDIIDQEVAASNKIITDLLTFARVKPSNQSPTDMHALLDPILKKFPPTENVSVKINLAQNLPHIWVDSQQIEQVLANLITNAYQAMPEGGSIEINAKTTGNALRLDIKDSGVGISPENLEKIFEPLFSTKTKGIGLGLTVSKMLTELNNGRIKVASQVGKGTTFTLFLPTRKMPVKEQEKS